MSAELDLAGIRARAEAARAGQWRAEDGDVFAEWTHGDHLVAMCTGSLPEGNRMNAVHIAGMDPVTTLALVDEVERLRAVVEAVEVELKRSFSMSAVNSDPHRAWRDAVAYVRDSIRLAILGASS